MKTVAAVRSYFPEGRHKIYTGEELRNFISKHIGTEAVAAYDSLQAYAAKADLGRYCLLYVLGGWYFDIAVEPMAHYAPSESTEFLAFRDIQRNSGTSWACQTAILYAKPNSKVLETAISMVLKNCRNKYYGITPLCPTATTLLGAALASFPATNNHVFGDFIELTPHCEIKNNAFVLPDGRILAWGKKAQGGDLKALGAKGVNNYNELWHSGKFYA